LLCVVRALCPDAVRERGINLR